MTRWMLLAAILALPLASQAQPVMMKDLDLGAVSCNWGVLSMRAITELDFEVGPHSADPDGDGIGRNDPDRRDPRQGLPNLLDEDLEAVCLLVGCSLFPEDPLCEE